MRTLTVLIGCLAVFSFSGYNPASWSEDEIQSADLARDLAGWSVVEKDVVLHTNLVRLYPQKYLRLVAEKWEMPDRYSALDKSTQFYRGLLQELSKMRPTHALLPSNRLQHSAACFARAQGRSGATGHNRSGTGCPDLNTAENCDYGMNAGEDVVMHLLIDEDIPSLGHRKNLLNPEYFTIGVGHGTHARYGQMTVQEFSRDKQ